MNSVDLPFAVISYQEPVVHIVFKEGVNLDGAETQKLINSCNELANQKSVLVFADMRVFLNVSTEARAVGSCPENTKRFVAAAVLVNSLAMKLVANFFKSVNQPHFKFKVFNNKDKALKWLEKFDSSKRHESDSYRIH